ncbi:hypothetical protein QVZ41_08980 [Wenyingzhuangia sp. chi5]|uniref:Uncharacterized protein n=1 Tax=Wenyingzhuangia gilva TaxID=3057677 RepID=A0ABT8VSM8_9FLAO|nr:hypothetical protein [Wenyingzhuangia sp. chi5]MDO3694973.1 hypothetical protein [Wenyingzhuangia sp. chi5]
MEQFLDYYNFSDFSKDLSSFFDTIAYAWIKDDLYLVLEKKEELYNVHFTSYDSKEDIGKQKPNGLNTLIEDFKLDDNDHRKVVQQYLDYN